MYGISRRKPDFLPDALQHISLDLLNAEECRSKLKPLTDITHVFCCAWINKVKEEDNCRTMKAMVRKYTTKLKAPDPCAQLLFANVPDYGQTHRSWSVFHVSWCFCCTRQAEPKYRPLRVKHLTLTSKQGKRQ